MTVNDRVKNTLASLEGVLADFRLSHMESSNTEDKNIFSMLIAQTEDVLGKFKSRAIELENEPQGKKEEE